MGFASTTGKYTNERAAQLASTVINIFYYLAIFHPTQGGTLGSPDATR